MKRYFIADLHLQPERPEITRAFLYFLNDILGQEDELYLLGDIFEYWIGDDAPLDGMETVLNSLRTLSDKGATLYFQHGNRDFLVGSNLLAGIGATLLPEASVIDLNQGPALIMHGDQLCIDDAAYQEFRTQVRDPNWQEQFLSAPITHRQAIAEQMRAESKAQGSMKADAIMDVNAGEVRDQMRRHGVELLIHGHTHRPAIHTDQLETGKGKRIVLGDWSAAGWYLVEDGNNLDLIRFTPE